METVHYLILGGAAALVAAILFPGFRSKAKAVVAEAIAPAPVAATGSPMRSAFRELHDIAEGLAYQRLEAEIADKRAGKIKAEIQEMFAFDQAASAAASKAKS